MANTKLSLSTDRRAVELAILAKGTASLTAPELAAVRQQPLDRLPTPLRPQFLRHSDDQTLAALTALTRAIDAYGVADNFHDWAIVSSTRYLGRAAFAAVIDKYQIDGPWGVSVQVIPHTAPHAVAGTVSLALGSHGPSLGAGAARGEESQALATAAALLRTPDLSGAWILLTGWSTEHSMTCIAAALAVVSVRPDAPHGNPCLGRIAIEACPPEHAGASARGDQGAAPLTELLARHRDDDLHWTRTCRGMRTAVELRGDQLPSSQPRVSRAA
ncbi:MAG TPA: hypothetical protein VG125_08025 [Pirellulales bacterium]|jgi:hypothetical protein|nr:hypothetical protein [Pirellulales bacterium]